MTNKALYLAILLSTGLHLVLLLTVTTEQRIVVIDTPARPIGNMTLVVTAEHPPASVKSPPELSAQPSTRQVHSKPVQPIQPVSQTAITRAPVIQQHKNDDSKPDRQLAHSTDPSALIDHDMLEYLHSEFRVRFRYPLLARKRGWAGEVVIALNVNQRGVIDDIAVQKSSGYPLLDNNAVATFRAIGLVSPALQSRIRNTHHLFIPVIYKLTGG